MEFNRCATTVTVGTSCLAGRHYRLQGSHLGNTVDNRAPPRPVKARSSMSAPAHLQPRGVVSLAMGPHPLGSQGEWQYPVSFGKRGILLAIVFEGLARATQQEDKRKRNK